MKPETISISRRNDKLGAIPSVSLPHRKTCNPAVLKGCGKPGECYVDGMRPCCHAAYERNLRIWKHDPAYYEKRIRAFLARRRPAFFRWNVSGDFPDTPYFIMTLRLAREFPNTRFLAFTKRYQYCNASWSIPANYSVLASIWPGIPVSASVPVDWPRAYMIPPEPIAGYTVPSDVITCGGNCITCSVCWSLAKLGKSVGLIKHGRNAKHN